jgi:crotonobetainyl-CoA hydratase
VTTTLTAAESRDGVGGVIVTEETGGTLLVRLHRPDRLNSIDRPVTGALAAAVTRLEGSDHLRVGIITGAGRAFTAGADHTEVAAGEIDRLSTTEGGFGGLVRRRRTKPWFAAVNGLCFGKGWGCC